MTADYHLHSCFSGDSETLTEDMIKKGLERGLSLMCMTEHLDLDYPYEDVSFDLDAEAYVREMRRLQDVYRNRLELRIGGAGPSAPPGSILPAMAFRQVL